MSNNSSKTAIITCSKIIDTSRADNKNQFHGEESQMTVINSSSEVQVQPRRDIESKDQSIQPKTSQTKTSIVRYCISSLGLICAIVSCYAQMVFCIAIVEMVLPSHDDVYNNNNNLILNYTNNSTHYNSTQQLPYQITCPIDENYKSFYDQWRFNRSLLSSHNNTNTNNNTYDGDKHHQFKYNHNVDKFNWDAGQQGILLGAFAIGAAPLQVFGGRMAEIYGAKWVLFAAGFGTAVTNFLIPFIARYSYYLLIVIRIIMGISQSGMESALMCLFAEWLAPAETSFFISMLLFAICIGGFLGSLCSAYLLTLGFGWSITYYVASGLSFIWSILWLLFATSRPQDHKLLSKQELNYILSKQKRQLRCTNNRRSSTMISALLINSNNNQRLAATNNSNNSHIKLIKSNDADKNNASGDGAIDESGSQTELNNYIRTESPIILPPSPIPIPPIRRKSFVIDSSSNQHLSTAPTSAPWLNILTRPQVWVFIITKISVRWCADVITIELPTYLSNVLHLSIQLNGLLNSISAALFAIFSFISGCIANKLLKTRPGNLSKTNIRKIIQAFASFGGAIGLFLMSANDCNLMMTISMLMFLSCCLVFGTGGELQIPFDMTSEYPGTLHGLACTLSVSGWLAPPLVGIVLGDQPNSRSRWNIVWYSTAFISLIGGIVFVLFADARPIDFTINPCENNNNNNKTINSNSNSNDNDNANSDSDNDNNNNSNNNDDLIKESATSGRITIDNENQQQICCSNTATVLVNCIDSCDNSSERMAGANSMTTSRSLRSMTDLQSLPESSLAPKQTMTINCNDSNDIINRHNQLSSSNRHDNLHASRIVATVFRFNDFKDNNSPTNQRDLARLSDFYQSPNNSIVSIEQPAEMNETWFTDYITITHL